MTALPVPPEERPKVVEWVAAHLDGLFAGEAHGSTDFTGGQTAADAALAAFDVTGYAHRRNEVWPASRRGASRISPHVRHGLLTLRRVWESVSGPPPDVAKFRDELMWQEYARHLYARVGRAGRRGLRFELDGSHSPGWNQTMRCVGDALTELNETGWVVNQARMWLASEWTLRLGAAWQEGEEFFFTHLLDGSRAANRLGWQWTAGTATGRPYGFSRVQVERRAPGLCGECPLEAECPIQEWPDAPDLTPVGAPASLRSDPAPDGTGGPLTPLQAAEPEAVWLTAESLGDRDPALAARPDLPAVFVFDAPLLKQLQLSAKRLVFLAESLADLARRRSLEIWVGDPITILEGRQVAVTFAPVPGWRARAGVIQPVEIHPWPWLYRPHSHTVTSFSAWRKSLDHGSSDG